MYVIIYTYHRHFVAFLPLPYAMPYVVTCYVSTMYVSNPCILLIKSCKFCGIFTHPLHYVTCFHTIEMTFVDNNYINEKTNVSSDKI